MGLPLVFFCFSPLLFYNKLEVFVIFLIAQGVIHHAHTKKHNSTQSKITKHQHKSKKQTKRKKHDQRT